jgi:molybdate transport system substrate-binding protein
MNPLVKVALAFGALLIVGASLVAGFRGASSPAPARPLTLSIAAASDLKFALDEVVHPFRALHPQADLQVTYGSSGLFFAQIAQGAPFDLFLSADVAYPRKLAAQGLVHPSGIFPYAVGRIVLWVPRNSPLSVETLGIRVLLEPGARRIAIANPQHAPYGRAAEAALRSEGLYEAVKERLVFGENITQTAQFVQSGAADVGIIALSLALAPTLRDSGRYWLVPAEAHPPLEQGGAILQRAREPELALAFRDFLLGPEGRAILERYGFVLPQE